ncbi:MAG: RNA repair domain-containing protein [Myxococcales bacterium]|nr:RNA repair domain-containing protein [Myxococcales bacterium]
MSTDSDRRPFPDGQRVYHQLRWDPRFDADACELVLADRPAGTKVIAFRDFLPNGPIPWHRIIGFRYRGEVLWDRASRLDRRDEALHGGLGRVGASVSVEALERHDAEVVPSLGLSAAVTTSPTIVTWNVLSDAWDGELLDHPSRWRRLLDETLAAQPDVVVFTEATDTFFSVLMADASLRSRFTVVSSEHSDVVVLSRAQPSQTAALEFAPGREAIVCWYDDLVIAGLHLPSDRETSRRAERERDLTRLSQTLLGSHSLVIAGDFNAQDDELDALVTRLHGLDAWSTAAPTLPGLTYDVDTNPIAGALTKRGRSSRLDRILVFGERLDANDARLLGVHAHATSDHFGLAVGLKPRLSTTTSHRSAVVLGLPVERWGPLQRLRARHDSRFTRWPPHVTLLYGFVEPATIDASLPSLARALASLAPFEVRFDRLVTFEHHTTTTLALTPSTPAEVNALQRRLVEAFPWCVEQNRGEGSSFTPHLTIARLAHGDRSTLAALRRELRDFSVSWKAGAVTVLERPDEAFHVHSTVSLGDGRLHRASERSEPTQTELERTLCSAIASTGDDLGVQLTVRPFGSRAYAPSLEGRDLDLLVTVEGSSSTVLDALEARLPAARRISRQVLRGDHFDVVAIDADAEDDDSRRFALGVIDANALRSTLERHGRAQVFDAVLPQVRAWSRERALEGNAFGYFGGIGWAVLLAAPLLHDAELCAAGPDDAFRLWQRWLAALDRRALISVAPSPSFEHDDFTILSPAEPHRPVTRAMIASTRAVLFEAFGNRPDDVHAWLTVRGPAAALGAWQQRCLSIFSVLDRELGPVLRVRGEAPVIERGQFTARIGLRSRDTGRIQQLFTAQLARLQMSAIGCFVTPR